MDGLRWKGGACGCKLIADPTDEIGGAIRAGHRIAGLGHRFRPGKRTINLDGLGQADIQEGGAIGPGFFGFLAEDLADVFHLCPGGFAVTKLPVDFAPGRQLDSALMKDAASPDNAPIRADDVGVWGVFVEVPGLARGPPKFVTEESQVAGHHLRHLMPTHLLHPTGMSGSLEGPPLLIATEHRRKNEFVTVRVRLAKAVGPMDHREHQRPTALNADPLRVIEACPTTGDPGGHILLGPMPVVVQLPHQGQGIELPMLLRQQVGDSWEERPDGMRHAMETTADFPDQAVPMKIAATAERCDRSGPHDPCINVRLRYANHAPEFRIMVRRTDRSIIRQITHGKTKDPSFPGGGQVAIEEGRGGPHRGGRLAHPGVARAHEDVHGPGPCAYTLAAGVAWLALGRSVSSVRRML